MLSSSRPNANPFFIARPSLCCASMTLPLTSDYHFDAHAIRLTLPVTLPRQCNMLMKSSNTLIIYVGGCASYSAVLWKHQEAQNLALCRAWPFIWPWTTIFKAHASISLNNRILDSLPTFPTFQFQVLLSLFRHTCVSSISAIWHTQYFIPKGDG